MRSRRFWFHTIGLSVTVAILSAVAIAVITVTAVLALGQKEPPPNDSEKVQNLAGLLTDAHCRARHSRNSRMSARDCARICVKRGSSWALVGGDKVYVLTGDSPDLDKMAGERVKISGVVEGNAVLVQSVAPALP